MVDPERDRPRDAVVVGKLEETVRRTEIILKVLMVTESLVHYHILRLRPMLDKEYFFPCEKGFPPAAGFCNFVFKFADRDV